MNQYKPWPHIVDVDDEIRAAVPSVYLKYDICITDRKSCEFFINMNGEEWRECAELILKKWEKRVKKLKTDLNAIKEQKKREEKWYHCPFCGKSLFPLQSNTKIRHMPFRCKACKHNIEVNI